MPSVFFLFLTFFNVCVCGVCVCVCVFKPGVCVCVFKPGGRGFFVIAGMLA
jgi:hypothetical protein